jgi:hypothetical protein
VPFVGVFRSMSFSATVFRISDWAWFCVVGAGRLWVLSAAVFGGGPRGPGSNPRGSGSVKRLGLLSGPIGVGRALLVGVYRLMWALLSPAK